MSSLSWKLSASVIIALRSPTIYAGSQSLHKREKPGVLSESEEKSNIKLLTLRRGESDKYLPGTYVFPGGTIDESDSNPEWLELYKSFGFDETSFRNLIAEESCPSISRLKELRNTLPNWLTLRLCAVRETFEESGVLLCRTPTGVNQKSPITTFTTLRDLKTWQRRVKSDPRQMIALCQSENCVPDIWGLHLWSNWLTPAQQRVRHNTIFFLAVLLNQPPSNLDHLEMDELKWCSPFELLDGARTGKHRLINPQFYETSRLCVFSDAETLAAFASNRARKGCSTWMPVQEKTQDGMLFLLPGDSDYPENIEGEISHQLITREETLSELSAKVFRRGGTLHRMEIQKGDCCPQITMHNYTPNHHHVIPISSANEVWSI